MSTVQPDGEEDRLPVEAGERDGERPGSFGVWLRRQREGRGITLREIADTSKISIRYLQAFEEGRFDLLPAEIFAKGFLRQYASYVGLDPEEVVNFYLSQVGPREGEEEREEEEPPPARAARFPAWAYVAASAAAALVLLGVVAAIGGLSERRREGSEPTSGVPSPSPVAEPAEPAPAESEASAQPPSAAAETPPLPLRVILDFTDECWVEARIDGGRRVAELHVQGESLQLEAEREVELTLGDAGAVEVEVNGEPFDLEPRAGGVARGIRIDLETARRLAAEEG